jgi:hypothetical protein
LLWMMLGFSTKKCCFQECHYWDSRNEECNI